MDKLEQRLVELKQAEKQKFYELYEFSVKANFKGDENEVDIYINYINTRQNIIDQIDKIDTLFNQTLDLADIRKYIQIDKINKEISALANKIIEIDKKNNELMAKVSSDISKEIVKTTKRIDVNNRYTTSAVSIGSVFFDSRN